MLHSLEAITLLGVLLSGRLLLLEAIYQLSIRQVLFFLYYRNSNWKVTNSWRSLSVEVHFLGGYFLGGHHMSCQVYFLARSLCLGGYFLCQVTFLDVAHLEGHNIVMPPYAMPPYCVYGPIYVCHDHNVNAMWFNVKV